MEKILAKCIGVKSPGMPSVSLLLFLVSAFSKCCAAGAGLQVWWQGAGNETGQNTEMQEVVLQPVKATSCFLLICAFSWLALRASRGDLSIYKDSSGDKSSMSCIMSSRCCCLQPQHPLLAVLGGTFLCNLCTIIEFSLRPVTL